MNKKLFTLIAGFGLATLLASSQTAPVQIIHNATNADSVDIYVDGVLAVADFKYRTATPYVDLNADGNPINVQVAPGNSSSAADAIFSKSLTLSPANRYIVMAAGEVGGTTAFDLYPFDAARNAAGTTGNTDVLAFHGSTDAGTVGVYEMGAGVIADPFAFSDFAGYVELTNADYYLKVTATGGTPSLLGYDAPLATLGLEDAAITVVASGYLAPSLGEPAFGLYAITAAGGEFLALPTSMSRIQIVHNSPSAAADSVDIYIDDELTLPDVMFRTATAFIDMKANSEFEVKIAPGSSSSSADAIWNQKYTLDPTVAYQLMAAGEVGTTFDVFVEDSVREEAAVSGNTDVIAFHGSPDAGNVGVYENALGVIADPFAFADFAGYLELPNDDYYLKVTATGGTPSLLGYDAPLASLQLENEAVTVIASGYLAPTGDEPAFGLYAITAAGGEFLALPTSMSRIQIVHNSPSAAADSVDIYIDDELTLPDVMFRTATAFIDMKANSEFEVKIAPGSSSSSADAIWNQKYTLDPTKAYMLMAAGEVGGSGATAFDVFVTDMAREMASTSGNTDVLAFHGSTDAGTVGVYESTLGTVADPFTFADFAGYLELPNDDYYLKVTAEGGMPSLLGYDAPLATLGLENEAVTVIASGYLAPTGDEPAFGLYAITAAGGEFLALPTSMSRIQIVHNSPSAAADSVDIYIDDELTLPDVMFRTATAFIDMKANSEFEVKIAPGSSSSSADAIWNQKYTLDPTKAYMLMAAGEVGGSGATAFDVFVTDMAREMASTSGNTDVLAFHGSTDAGTVGVYESTLGTVADPFTFADFAGYLELPNDDYYLKVTAEGGMPSLLGYDAPLATLGLENEAVTVIASGYLAPMGMEPAFGLFAITAAGGEFLALPASMARVQVIHNSADMAAEMVDVYLNDGLLIDDFKFRNASSFIDAPAGSDFDIVIQPSTSTDTTNALWRKSYQLMSGESYVLVANGIVSASGYSPAEAFDIYVFGMGREMASTSGNTDLLVFHGSTDAPTVDIYEATAGMLIDNLSYGEFDSDYIELSNADYVIQVRDETGATTVASYEAPLATLGLADSALVAVASGFFTPANNSNGAAFGIWVALPSGGALIELPMSTVSTNDLSFESSMNVQLYPNPVSDILNVAFSMESTGDVAIEIISITGQTMLRRDIGQRSAGDHIESFNMNNLEAGIYMLRLNAGDSVQTSGLKVVK